MTDEARVIVRGIRKVGGLPPRQPLPRSERQQVGPRAGDPYWQERGWAPREVNTFTGWYQAGGRRFAGRIDPRGPEFLIRRPPDALRSHPHWVCFRYQDNGWYLVHFALQPRDMSSGIMEIERILNEALGRAAPNAPRPVVSQPPRPVTRAAAPARAESRVTPRPIEEVVVPQPPRLAPTRAQIRKEIHDQTRAAGRLWRWLYVLIVILILALVALVV